MKSKDKEVIVSSKKATAPKEKKAEPKVTEKAVTKEAKKPEAKKPVAKEVKKEVTPKKESEALSPAISEKKAEPNPAYSEEKIKANNPELVEKTEVAMAIPPELNGKKSTGEKKHHRLFSWPIFKESLKSNRVGLAVCAGGNALIMIIIIGILSTLNVNSTASALTDMFNNASLESTVKSGSISVYSATSGSAQAYVGYEDGQDQMELMVTKSVNLVDDSTLNNSLSTAETAYKTVYRLTSGDDATKALTAKTTVMRIVDTELSNQASMSEDEKTVARTIISDFFDLYAKDQSAETKTLLKQVIPQAFSEVIAEKQGLDKDATASVKAAFDQAFSEYFDNSIGINVVKTEAGFSLVKLLATGDTRDFAVNTTNDLETWFNYGAATKPETEPTDEEKAAYRAAYVADTTIQSSALSADVQSYVVEMANSFAYYAYLPTFTVNYVTDDLGYPITYVPTGEYADDGTPIKKVIEVKSYNPDVYIKVQPKMGTNSNLAQKAHKDLLTGEDYTDAEITSAKKQASADIETLRSLVSDFMGKFLTRNDKNQNDYYDGSNVIDSGIQNYVIDYISAKAEKQLIDEYNEKHTPHVSSISEITAENNAMDGQTTMNTVKGYTSGAIASYKTYLTEAENNGYTTMDAMMIGTSKASAGVIDQLPTAVGDSLSEMGGMNTYGIIVGVVAFGIANILIPMVYTILTATNLVADKIESGSLAFTLSTPTPRKSYIFTEAIYLLFTETVMGLALWISAMLAQIIGIAAGSNDLATSLPLSDICFYALGNYLVTVAISGICFFASCWNNKSDRSIGEGGGLNIFFFICSILGLFATQAIPGTIRINAMNVFNYMTINSLFDAMAVMNNDWFTYWFKLIWLVVIALVGYIGGSVRFCKKDLPL